MLITTPDGAILGRSIRASSAGDQDGAAEAIAAIRERAGGVDVVVVGTIDAIRQPAQIELVRAVASAGRPAVAVALRTPWDVALFPAEAAALCTYSILPDSLEALAAGLAGEMPFGGRLPVSVPGFARRPDHVVKGAPIAAGGAGCRFATRSSSSPRSPHGS